MNVGEHSLVVDVISRLHSLRAGTGAIRNNLSQTWKDSARKSIHRIVLEIATNDDGTYEITVNDEVVGKRISESWLDDELCAKRGFCGHELAEIKGQLRESGKAVLIV